MKKSQKIKKSSQVSIKTISDATLNKIFIAILFILPLIYFASLLSGSKMMYGSDWLIAGYSLRSWITECIKLYSQVPMWDPGAFGGVPMGNLYSFHTLLYLTLPVHIGWTYLFVFATFFAGLGIYLYLKELKISVYSSFIGAIIYMGCGSVLSMTYPGHDGKILATAFFPFILLLLHKGLTRHKLVYFLLAGAIGGIAAINAHFQLIYYASVLLAFYLLYHLIWQRKENGIKKTLVIIGYSLCALLLAGGLVSIHYIPIFGTMEWGARGAGRGYEFATSWSLAPNELLDLLTPHFSGLQNNYWGENYFKLDTQYLGILPLLLALLAIIFSRKEKYVRFFTGLIIVTILFAFGGHTPLYHIPYWILPGLKKFRCPTMIFYLTSFGIAILASFGAQALEDSKLKRKNLKITLGIIFGIVAIFAIICSVGKTSVLSSLKAHWSPIFLSKYGHQLAQQKLQNLTQNYPNFLGGLGKALLLIAINSILILLLAMKRLKVGIWILIAIPILIFDQWSIEKKFLKTAPHPQQYYAPDEIVNFLRNDGELYRILPLNYEHSQDGYLSIYNIQNLGGYVSNPGSRYQKLIGAGESVMFTPLNLMRHRNILDILNTKYIISMWIPEDLSKYPPKTQQMITNFKNDFSRKWNISWEEAHKGLKLVHRSNRGYGIYKNETTLPRAFIVHNFKTLPQEKIIEELKNPDFHPETTVLIEEQAGIEAPDTGLIIQNTEKVTIDKYTPNEIVCTATLESPGFLVFSGNWHPDWKVLVDGKKEKLYVANYTLRAVQLDEGKHCIEFNYDSLHFKLGAIISFLALLFFLGTIGFWFKFYKGRK